jgi:hypothetical protein
LLVNIGDFLVKAAFTGANFVDAFQKLVEVVSAKAFVEFQAFIVQHKTFENIFPEGLGCPNAEARGFKTIDAIADCNDGVEIVKIGLIGSRSSPSEKMFPKCFVMTLLSTL